MKIEDLEDVRQDKGISIKLRRSLHAISVFRFKCML